MYFESIFAMGLVASMGLVVIAAMEQTVQSFYAENMAPPLKNALKCYNIE
jgi:hypothetical protein